MRRFVVGVGVLLFAVSAQAAVVMCARPRSDGTFNTTIKLRSGACTSHETQLDAAALGLPNKMSCQTVRLQPLTCGGPTTTGDAICASDAPGNICVATVRGVNAVGLADMVNCADLLDACAVPALVPFAVCCAIVP